MVDAGAWPTNSVGYNLEYATNFPARAWSRITNAVVVNGDLFTVELESTEPKQFYRLHK